MEKKQLINLFLCSLAMFTVGNGLIPLLPVYAIRLGADPATAGFYLSFSYLMLAAGVFFAGWLSDKYRRRKAFLILSGLLGVLGIGLMGRAANIWQLVILTGTTWFLGGIGLSLINILAGLFAGKTERGKIFGILAVTGSLGALIGGAAAGPVVDKWGYAMMFMAASVYCFIWPLAAFFVEDKPASGELKESREQPANWRWLTGGVSLLFLASLVATIAVFVNILGISVAMNNLGFSAAAISSTGAVGGAIALPLPVLLGWLSDRVGRKQLLTLCYLAGLLSLLILAVSKTLWNFWLAASFGVLLFDVNRGIGSAFVTDLVPKESLGKGLAIFNAMPWLAGIIGFALTGYAIEVFGMAATFIIAAFLPFTGIILVISIRKNVYAPGNTLGADRHAKR